MDLVRRGPRPEKLHLDEVIKQFQAALSPEDASDFTALQSKSAPKASDVFRLIEKVNQDAHKTHRTWRQYGGRLQKALDQILVFTKVGDILVGGSQNMIACGVWAVVRLSIQIATGYLSFFDKVSNLWMRIGRSSEVQEELVQLFPQCTELQNLMFQYLVTTITFCQRIIAFAKRPFISQITSTFSITFDKEFNEFEHQLAHLAKLMNQKIRVLTTQMTLDSSRTMAKTSKLLTLGSLAARERDYEYRRVKLLSKLCPSQDRFDRRQRHERKKGPVTWIFQDPDYIGWADGGSTTSSCLLLTGKIGSGKTVAAANIISSLQASLGQSDREAVAGFFCRASDPSTLQTHTIMGSIAHQFVRSLGRKAKGAISKYLPSRNTQDDVIEKTLETLPRAFRYFIIIDALDECKMENVKRVVDSLRRFGTGRSFVQLLFSCRAYSPIIPAIRSMSVLFSDPVISFRRVSLWNPKHDQEIEMYIDSEIEARRHIRKLSPELEAAVRMALIAGAQGMFLWATLQLDLIYPQNNTHRTLSDSDLQLLVESIPKDLETMFDKTLENISDRGRAKKVFELVATSERPLTTDELAVATNIEPGNLNWDQSTFPLNPNALVWTCGGGLLEEVEEDDTVHYIHHSALRHLLLDGIESPGPEQHHNPAPSPYKFSLEEANTVIAAICVTYLSYAMHESRLMRRLKLIPNDRDIIDTVLSNCVARNQTTVSYSSLTNKLISRVLDRRKPPSAQSSATIFNMVSDLARQKHEDDHDRAVRRFSDYASRHWLDHTKHFISPSDLKPGTNVADGAIVSEVVYTLFCSLARSDLPHFCRPWIQDTNAARIRWALRAGHLAIYRLVLRIGFGHGPHTTFSNTETEYFKPTLDEILEALTTSPDSVKIEGKELGAVIALCIYFGLHEQTLFRSLRSSIETLITFGVDPNSPVVAPDGSIWSPLCFLLRLYSSSRFRKSEAGKGALTIPQSFLSTVKYLLFNGASPVGFPGDTKGGPRPVFMALDLELWSIASKMIKHIPSTDADLEDEHGRTLLGMLIIHSNTIPESHLHCYQLLRDGANPNKPTSTTRISSELYDARFQVLPNRRSYQPPVPEPVKIPLLILAARDSNYDIFHALLTRGASLDLPFRGEPVWKALDRIIRNFGPRIECGPNPGPMSSLFDHWEGIMQQRGSLEAFG